MRLLYRIELNYIILNLCNKIILKNNYLETFDFFEPLLETIPTVTSKFRFMGIIYRNRNRNFTEICKLVSNSVDFQRKATKFSDDISATISNFVEYYYLILNKIAPQINGIAPRNQYYIFLFFTLLSSGSSSYIGLFPQTIPDGATITEFLSG